jgi:hypothetical protein
MDTRRFNMVYGGRFERMEGLVYDCFDEDENTIEPSDFPEGTIFYAGIDWGYTDPFVLLVRAVTPNGKHVQVSEYYKPGLTLPQMIEIARQKKEVWDIKRFYADPSQPGFIEEFNRRGLICTAANNDIRVGIDIHYELIKTRRFQIWKRSSPHTVDEITMYHWPDPQDLKPDQDGKERNPVKQQDHAMDAMWYLSIMTYKAGGRMLTPIITDETPKVVDHHDRIRNLKKLKTSGKHEDWI